MGGVLHRTSVASFGVLEDSAEIKETRKVDQLGEHYLCLANDFLTNWGRNEFKMYTESPTHLLPSKDVRGWGT